MQNRENTVPSTSSEVTSPQISPIWCRASRMSCVTNSVETPAIQGFLEGLVVAEVGDEGGGGVGCVGCGGVGEGCGDFGEAEAVAGADGEGAGRGEALSAGEALG